MYKKENHQFTIAEALEKLISDKRMKSGLNESVIKQEWEKIMGPAIASHTTGLYLKGSELTVYFNSSIVKQEFIYGKEKAISLINEALGSDSITELIIK